MPFADPERAAAYNRQWWRENGRAYRRANPERVTAPISCRQEMDRDLEQVRALARIDPRTRRNPEAAVKAYRRRELAWLAVTAPLLSGPLDDA